MYPVNMPARMAKAAAEAAFHNCDCLDSITGSIHAHAKAPSPHTAKKALRQGNSMKEDFIERPYFSFTPAKGIREQVSCPSYRQDFWGDLVNARELRARKANGKFAC